MTISTTKDIKQIHYVWRTFQEHMLKTSKVTHGPLEVLGDNVASLILNLNPDWDRAEYSKWVKHWKITYKELSRGTRLTKKWRKTSLIPQDKQEVSLARSNECREMRVLASQLISLRKAAKILADAAYTKGR